MLEISVSEVVEAARRLLAADKDGGQECPPLMDGAHG
jgi:hypothetical protein